MAVARKMVLFAFVNLFLWGCSLQEKPEFLYLENIRITDSNLQHVIVQAEAVFSNPNDLGGTLGTDQIAVFLDDRQVATVHSETFDVPARDTFSVPLTVDVPTSELLENSNNDLLGSILKQLVTKKVLISFKGDMKYTVLGYTSTYPIDHTEEILIK